MTTPTPSATPDDGMPAFLKEKAKQRASTRAAAKSTTAPAPAAVQAAPAPATPSPAAAKIATKHNKQVKAAKPATPKPAPKAKAATPHKPSDIARTEGNPAKSIVPVRFKQKYAEHDNSNGDKLAYAVKAFCETKNDDGRTVLSMANLERLARDNGIDFGAYAHLNNGQKSMNVRNRLRGLLKAGKKVTVGKQVFADAAKALAVQA